MNRANYLQTYCIYYKGNGHCVASTVHYLATANDLHSCFYRATLRDHSLWRRANSPST